MPMVVNPAVKLLVVNYAWKLAATGFLTNIAATPAVGRDLERIDPMGAIVAESLEDAMEKAYDLAGTEKSVLIVPGDHFGVDGHLRISYGLPHDYLRDGLDRIHQMLVELEKAGA